MQIGSRGQEVGVKETASQESSCLLPDAAPLRSLCRRIRVRARSIRWTPAAHVGSTHATSATMRACVAFMVCYLSNYNQTALFQNPKVFCTSGRAVDLIDRVELRLIFGGGAHGQVKSMFAAGSTGNTVARHRRRQDADLVGSDHHKQGALSQQYDGVVRYSYRTVQCFPRRVSPPDQMQILVTGNMTDHFPAMDPRPPAPQYSAAAEQYHHYHRQHPPRSSQARGARSHCPRASC